METRFQVCCQNAIHSFLRTRIFSNAHLWWNIDLEFAQQCWSCCTFQLIPFHSLSHISSSNRNDLGFPLSNPCSMNLLVPINHCWKRQQTPYLHLFSKKCQMLRCHMNWSSYCPLKMWSSNMIVPMVECLNFLVYFCWLVDLADCHYSFGYDSLARFFGYHSSFVSVDSGISQHY